MPRLFFDEPLSEELCTTLADIFPDSLHIRLLGYGGAADAVIWELARQHECLVVSKDEDFQRLAILRGAPPKFVWIRLGNCTTDDVAQLLRRHRDDIIRFNEQSEATVLELG
jgi:predicted nuclease of predicted toxin-antitoxin system